jgi:hypothetical protein
MPIQYVRTRWNSTFLMIRRAPQLQPTFDEFCAQFDLTEMKMDKDEWRQVDYLLFITFPFLKFVMI